MKINLRDALEHIITSTEKSTESPEWESQYLGDVLSTMDDIATRSLTHVASSRGDLRLAFQTLDTIEPQDEFQAAMTQYARASLRLLENLGGTAAAGAYTCISASTVIPEPAYLTDQSRVNLLQSLTDYTDSRVTIAGFTSFPSTPFSDTRSRLRSITTMTPQNSSQDISPMDRSPLQRERPSMSSKHLINRMSFMTNSNSLLNTPITYNSESDVFRTPTNTYEPLSVVSNESPSTVIPAKTEQETESYADNDETSIQIVVDPFESHDQNTAFCKSLALQALDDTKIEPSTSASALSVENNPPKLRPLGGSSSFRHVKGAVRSALPRRHSINGDPLYMKYGVKPAPPTSGPAPTPPLPRNTVPPRKPARMFSTKSKSRSTHRMDSVNAQELEASVDLQDLGKSVPSAAVTELAPQRAASPTSPSRRFHFIDKTRSLINRARFGSRVAKKKGLDTKVDPNAGKSKTL